MIALKTIARRSNTQTSFSEVGSIGVDFSNENINLAQLGRLSNGEIGLKSSCSIRYEKTREELLKSPKYLRPILRQACKEYGFKGKSVISSMPSNVVRILSINYTKSKNTNASDSILQALSARLDDDLSTYVIDYLPVRSNDKEGEQLALVALVKRDLVISYLELLRYAGFHVQALEIRPAAIKRLVYAMQSKKEFKNVLVINFGTERSYLTITSGRRLLFDQQINFGSDVVVNRMSAVLDMTKESTLELIDKHGFDSSKNKNSTNTSYADEDITKTLLDIVRPVMADLVEEINRVLIFSASENHGESITRIYLLGSLAHWNGIDKHLFDNIKIPVESLCDPLAIFNNKNLSSGENSIPELTHGADMAIAAGLALKGLVEYG